MMMLDLLFCAANSWKMISLRKQPTTCQSEASSIGEDSAGCRQRNSRFLTRCAALRNDKTLGF